MPIYNVKDLQFGYREYIIIVQIERGNIVCPEVILPTRLNINNRKIKEDIIVDIEKK